MLHAYVGYLLYGDFTLTRVYCMFEFVCMFICMYACK